MKICVAHPAKDVYSQTFVRAHVERMPGEVVELWGGLPPVYSRRGPLVGRSLFHKGVRRVLSKALRLESGHFHGKAVAKFLRANAVDAVLAEFGPTGVHLAGPCREAGVPLAVHFHGYDAHAEGTLREYRDGYRRLFDDAAAVVAVSREMEAQLAALGAPREKIRYNPCGVDLARFRTADPAGAPPVFLAVGRFTDKKAPFLTILAFHRTRQAVPTARLVMIGDGPLWEASRCMASSLGDGDAVEFRGPRPHEEIVEAMAGARAFVQHSVKAGDGDSEGTPVAVLEAAAAGLPVVATAHAGIKDAVADGTSGFLVREGDVEGMAAAMIRLAGDPALAGRLGRAARETLPERFHMENSIRGLYEILREAAGARRA